MSTFSGSGTVTEFNINKHLDVTQTDNGNRSAHSPSIMPRRTTCEVHLNMLCERDRLKTFARWPCEYMEPKEMARTGFYYYNFEDYVRCSFCSIEIGRWERGDEPAADHQRWSSSCPFLRGMDVGNVPMDPDDDEVVLSRPPVDTCGRFGIQMRPNSVAEQSTRGIDLSALGVTPSRNPVYSMHSTVESRLDSFKEWPCSLKQKPEQLAEAGFFYTGKGDQTLCFSCGGGLKDWVETDDPWEQHAKWFSKCSYVLMVKGKSFVTEVCNRLQALLTPQQAAQVEPPQGPSESAPAPAPVAPPVAAASTSEPPATKPVDDGRLCKICYTEELGVLFLPCSHIVACVKCAPSLTTCAVCRQPFSATVRAYLS